MPKGHLVHGDILCATCSSLNTIHGRDCRLQSSVSAYNIMIG
jgi:hypothetical protein